MLPNSELHHPDHHLSSLYRLGAAAALGMIAAALVDIAVTFLPGSASPAPGDVRSWFALYQANAFFGLRGLGILNIMTTSLAVIVFFALVQAHRRANPTYAALALVVLALASGIYIANNRALPMLGLSRQYQAAVTDEARSLLLAAGQGMLAQGEDFTPGTFLGFTLTETAGVIMSLVLLRGRVFNRATALTCLAGYALLILYSSAVCFNPENFAPLLGLSMVGGLISLAGYTLIARRLLQLGAQAGAEAA